MSKCFLCERTVPKQIFKHSVLNEKVCNKCYWDQDNKSIFQQVHDKQLATLRQRVNQLEAADYWKNWVYPEGATPEQIQNELVDYKMVMGIASEVYDHITHGRISKPNTLAREIIAVADEVAQELLDEELAELRKELEGELQGYETLKQHHKNHHQKEDELEGAWISVDEPPIENGKYVVGGTADKDFFQIHAYWEDGEWSCKGLFSPTHWRPLPEPPTGEDK